MLKFGELVSNLLRTIDLVSAAESGRLVSAMRRITGVGSAPPPAPGLDSSAKPAQHPTTRSAAALIIAEWLFMVPVGSAANRSLAAPAKAADPRCRGS